MTDIQKQKNKHLRLGGKSYKDIAATMNLNENTVKTYCRRNGLTDKDITLMFSEKKNKCLYCGAKINQTPKQKPVSSTACSIAAGSVTDAPPLKFCGEVVISDYISAILSFQVENAFSRLSTIQLSLKGNSPPFHYG